MSAAPNERSATQILVCPNPESTAFEAARLFVQLADENIRTHGIFTVALSGGSTPKRLFEILASPGFQKTVEWKYVHLFWGDERYVPSDHVESNFRMTMETLLSKVAIPPANVHRVRTELAPAEAVAANYESEIARFFAKISPGRSERFPKFDLVLLGLGTNAHTASLFPHSQALQENTHLIIAEFVAEVSMWRITMTAPLLNAGRIVVFLVTGSEKAHVVHDVLCGDYDAERKPAQLIQPTCGRIIWLLDAASANNLPTESYQRLN